MAETLDVQRKLNNALYSKKKSSFVSSVFDESLPDLLEWQKLKPVQDQRQFLKMIDSMFTLHNSSKCNKLKRFAGFVYFKSFRSKTVSNLSSDNSFPSINGSKAFLNNIDSKMSVNVTHKSTPLRVSASTAFLERCCKNPDSSSKTRYNVEKHFPGYHIGSGYIMSPEEKFAPLRGSKLETWLFSPAENESFCSSAVRNEVKSILHPVQQPYEVPYYANRFGSSSVGGCSSVATNSTILTAGSSLNEDIGKELNSRPQKSKSLSKLDSIYASRNKTSGKIKKKTEAFKAKNYDDDRDVANSSIVSSTIPSHVGSSYYHSSVSSSLSQASNGNSSNKMQNQISNEGSKNVAMRSLKRAASSTYGLQYNNSNIIGESPYSTSCTSMGSGLNLKKLEDTDDTNKPTHAVEEKEWIQVMRQSAPKSTQKRDFAYHKKGFLMNTKNSYTPFNHYGESGGVDLKRGPADLTLPSDIRFPSKSDMDESESVTTETAERLLPNFVFKDVISNPERQKDVAKWLLHCNSATKAAFRDAVGQVRSLKMKRGEQFRSVTHEVFDPQRNMRLGDVPMVGEVQPGKTFASSIPLSPFKSLGVAGNEKNYKLENALE